MEKREQRGAKGAKGAKGVKGAKGAKGSEGGKGAKGEGTSQLAKLSLPDIWNMYLYQSHPQLYNCAKLFLQQCIGYLFVLPNIFSTDQQRQNSHKRCFSRHDE